MRDPGDQITTALRAKFKTPQNMLRFLGLDENLLKRKGAMNNNDPDTDDDDDMDEQQIAEVLRANLPPAVCARLLKMLASASPEQSETETPELEYGDRARRRAKDGLRSGILPSAGRAMDAAPSASSARGFAQRFPNSRAPRQEGGVV